MAPDQLEIDLKGIHDIMDANFRTMNVRLDRLIEKMDHMEKDFMRREDLYKTFVTQVDFDGLTTNLRESARFKRSWVWINLPSLIISSVGIAVAIIAILLG